MILKEARSYPEKWMQSSEQQTTLLSYLADYDHRRILWISKLAVLRSRIPKDQRLCSCVPKLKTMSFLNAPAVVRLSVWSMLSYNFSLENFFRNSNTAQMCKVWFETSLKPSLRFFCNSWHITFPCELMLIRLSMDFGPSVYFGLLAELGP